MGKHEDILESIALDKAPITGWHLPSRLACYERACADATHESDPNNVWGYNKKPTITSRKISDNITVTHIGAPDAS